MKNQSEIDSKIAGILDGAVTRVGIRDPKKALFGIGTMIVGAFGMASAALPLPTSPDYRVILATCSLTAMIVGAFYVDRAVRRVRKAPPTKKNTVPTAHDPADASSKD